MLTYKFIGHPKITIKSIGQTLEHGEDFSIREEDITPEIKELIQMKLLIKVGQRLRGTRVYAQGRDFLRRAANHVMGRRNTPERPLPPQTSESSNQALLKAVREIVREEIANAEFISKEGAKAAHFFGEGQIKRHQKKLAREAIDSTETTLFIRPDEKDIKGDVTVEGKAEVSESVNSAVEKLKKKGKSSGKKTK